MRWLFIKQTLAWPRSSGHDVHSYHMMKSLAELGQEIFLMTQEEPSMQALDGLPVQWLSYWNKMSGVPNSKPEIRFTRLQERFRSYWGNEPEHIRVIGRTAQDQGVDVVVVVGVNVLPYLGAVQGAKRIWYAADEGMWHHLSQIRLREPSTWSHMRSAAISALYERSFVNHLDRIWLVTDSDRKAMQRVTGLKALDVLPNGVDANYYAPRGRVQTPRTCVFWGRLDFGPNVQALQWFCRHVWPQLRREVQDARFTIYGFKPTPEVQQLAAADGIALHSDLPDLREEIATQQVVVLPFVSGGGIKNKLLEAAAMGKAIVCSPRALTGLRSPTADAWNCVHGPGQWVKAIKKLWSDEAARRRLEAAARRWVTTWHSWETTARAALHGVEEHVKSDAV